MVEFLLTDYDYSLQVVRESFVPCRLVNRTAGKYLCKVVAKFVSFAFVTFTRCIKGSYQVIVLSCDTWYYGILICEAYT